MLSETKGWRRGQRRMKLTDTCISSKHCPKLKFKGYCGLWARECRVRQDILTELREKNRLKAEAEANGEEDDDEKEKEEPALERLLLDRLHRRCPYAHPNVKQSKYHTPEEKLEKLFIALFEKGSIEVPESIFEQEEEEQSEDDAEGKEVEEKLRRVVVRTATSVNFSYLRPIVAFYNESLKTQAPEAVAQSKTPSSPAPPATANATAHIPNLVPQEINLNSPKVLQAVLKAIKATHIKGQQLSTIVCRGNELKEGEEFITALRRFDLPAHLRSLDLSFNKLESLRILFHLKTHCSKLLNLSLLFNPITRKPDYREQIRRTLTQVMRLDGEIVRNPPLSLPHPTHSTDNKTHDVAMSWLAEYLSGIENGLLDEDYVLDKLHPSCAFSFVLEPGMQLFDPSKYEADQFEHDLLSAQDRAELDLFRVALETGTHDLLLGKIAIQRIARGPLNVLHHYITTVYQERFIVDHSLGFGHISVMELHDPVPPKEALESDIIKKLKALGAMKRPTKEPSGKRPREEEEPAPEPEPEEAPKPAPKATKKGKRIQKEIPAPADLPPQLPAPAPAHEVRVFTKAATVAPPLLITIHGAMTYRLPSMRAMDGIRVSYDRLFTLTRELVNGQEKLQLRNDQLTLRPYAELYNSNTLAKAQRLALVFGLDAQGKEGTRVVARMMERTNSDKALYDLLTEVTKDGQFPTDQSSKEEAEAAEEDEADQMTLVRSKSSAALKGDGSAETIARMNSSTKLH